MMTLTGREAIDVALFLNRQPELNMGAYWRSATSEYDATSMVRHDVHAVRIVIDERLFLEAIVKASIAPGEDLHHLANVAASNAAVPHHILKIFTRNLK